MEQHLRKRLAENQTAIQNLLTTLPGRQVVKEEDRIDRRRALDRLYGYVSTRPTPYDRSQYNELVEAAKDTGLNVPHIPLARQDRMDAADIYFAFSENAKYIRKMFFAALQEVRRNSECCNKYLRALKRAYPNVG